MFLDAQHGFCPGTSLKNGEALHFQCPADEEPNITVIIYNHSPELPR
jgi:hypothetical protein